MEVPTAPYELVELIEPDQLAPARARRAVAEFGSRCELGDQAGVLELLMSELVTNSVRHSGSTAAIRVAVTLREEYVCARVTDGGTGFVPRPGAMGTVGDGGMGLFMVDRCARRWGMTREADATRVWFELDFQAAA